MKTLFVSNLYPPLALGGYEQGCFDIAHSFRERGHEVHVLTSLFKTEQAPRQEEGVYRKLLLKTNWSMSEPQAASWVARNRLQLEWHNSRVMRKAIEMVQPDVTLFFNGGNMGRALLSVAEMNPPVAYSLSDPWLATVLGKQGGAKYGSLASIGSGIYHALLAALGIPFASIGTEHLIFCSRSIQALYERMGANATLGTVIHHGVVPEVWPTRPQRITNRPPSEPPTILYVGRIGPEKGVTTLVNALALVRRVTGLEDVRLRFVGPMHSALYEVQLQEQIASLGLGDGVEILPNHPRSTLPSIYAEHDVFAFTTEVEEAFSRTLLEAMSIGLPVVSSLRGGTAEIVRDGKNAIAFEAGNPSDLAQKLGWVLTHPNEAAVIGQAASQEIRQRYTLAAQVRGIEALLQPLIPGRTHDIEASIPKLMTHNS